ncbi:glycerate kinase [Bordetella hinzii CA90 BAL1384]|nr:glycerate kinase [Bordetella hinzii CA90 BAL1384]
MKIVIAPDSFKESLDAAAAARAIERGVKLACPGAHTVLVPMADGGEGTVDAVLAAAGGQARQACVRDALGRPIQASWGWLDHATAVIEMASAAGLEGIAPAERDALAADTHGVGELILAALDSGARKLILGLGGSATTDGGTGMLRALGARFLDASGQALAPGGGALRELARIDLDGLDPRLAGLEVEVACDVDNPLCGPQGAAHVFGPQKGATPAQVEQLDAALSRLADVAHHALGQDHRHAAGAGAAGGLGFAAHAFLRGRFRPGVALVAELGGLVDGRVAQGRRIMVGRGEGPGASPAGRHAGLHRRGPHGRPDLARQDPGRRGPAGARSRRARRGAGRLAGRGLRGAARRRHHRGVQPRAGPAQPGPGARACR